MDFDEVFDTQKAFRTIMDAFAHPLEPFALPQVEGGFEVLKKLAVFTLVDSAVSLNVHAQGPISAELFELTRARRSELEGADFVVADAHQDPEYLGRVRRGTLVDPQAGATVMVFAESLSGDQAVTVKATLSKSGQAKAVSLSGEVASCLARATGIQSEYPTGFDMLFVDRSGMAMAAPRRVRLAEGE